MTTFQIIGLVVIGLGLAASLRNLLTGRAARLNALAWILVWLGAAFAMLNPETTTTIAKRMGIERGADLILYCSVLCGMFGFLLVYTRLRRLRRQLTLFVREVALANAKEPPSSRGPNHNE